MLAGKTTGATQLLLTAVLPVALAHLFGTNAPEAQRLTSLFRLLKPGSEDLQNPAFLPTFATTTLEIGLRAATALPRIDRETREALQTGPIGTVAFSLPNGYTRSLLIGKRRITLATKPTGDTGAVILFSDWETASAAVAGNLDNLAAVNSGRIRVKGNVPLADHASFLLDRVDARLMAFR